MSPSAGAAAWRKPARSRSGSFHQGRARGRGRPDLSRSTSRGSCSCGRCEPRVEALHRSPSCAMPITDGDRLRFGADPPVLRASDSRSSWRRALARDSPARRYLVAWRRRAFRHPGEEVPPPRALLAGPGSHLGRIGGAGPSEASFCEPPGEQGGRCWRNRASGRRRSGHPQSAHRAGRVDAWISEGELGVNGPAFDRSTARRRPPLPIALVLWLRTHRWNPLDSGGGTVPVRAHQRRQLDR